MSSLQRDAVGWVALHYEKLVLLALLVVLALSGVWLVLRVENVGRALGSDGSELEARAPQPAEPLDQTPWAERTTAIKDPFQTAPGAGRLMVSERRVRCIQCGKPIPFDATECFFCGTPQPEVADLDQLDSSGDGIPDWWKIQHGLNPYDSRDAHEDHDGDGFTALEEFLAGTDPNDPESFPPPVVKLRVAGVQTHPFHLRFQGVQTMPDGQPRYLLNLRQGERSHFVKIGDDVEGFEVVAFEPGQPGAEDDSVLVLQQNDTVIRLEKNRPLTRHQRSAMLLFLIDGSRFHVRSGDSLDLMERRYEVVDIHRETVVLEDGESGKTWQVPRLTESERRGRSRERGVEAPGADGDPMMEFIDEAPLL